MRTHTLLTKVTSMAVCFGVLLSGPVMAGNQGIIKDVELSSSGTLVGQVRTSEGKAIANAPIQLRYQGKPVAVARSNADGRFAVAGVRGGAHELAVGAVNHPVRLWNHGTAPNSATSVITVAAAEKVIRGQNFDSGPFVQGGPTGFGMLDVITLATVGAAGGALFVGIDNMNTLEDNQTRLNELNAAVAGGAIGPASP